MSCSGYLYCLEKNRKHIQRCSLLYREIILIYNSNFLRKVCPSKDLIGLIIQTNSHSKNTYSFASIIVHHLHLFIYCSTAKLPSLHFFIIPLHHFHLFIYCSTAPFSFPSIIIFTCLLIVPITIMIPSNQENKQ